MIGILLLGGGGHCRACIDVIEGTEQYEVAGIVERADFRNATVLGYPVLGRDEDLARLLSVYPNVLVTVGQISTAEPRRLLYERAAALGAAFPSVRAGSAAVSRHAQLDAGAVVMNGAVVGPGALIGVNCIVNNLALVEHDVQLGPHVHVATGARVNGAAQIGTGAFIGSGAIVHQGVSIGEGCIVPAGVVVRRDIPAGSLVRALR